MTVDLNTALPERAGDLALALSPFPVSIRCGTVYETLIANIDCPAYAVVDDDCRPVGLVNRLTFLSRYTRRFVPELFHTNPISRLMDGAPLVVDESMPISELGRQVAIERPDALLSGFIIAANGRYKGIGTGHALISSKVQRDALRTLELQQAFTEAYQARRAMSHFLALMSHELRTPLNAIIGFSDMLHHERLGPIGEARYVEYAKYIQDSGEHLLSLITDILDLSKAESGHLELECGPVDLRHTVPACLRLVSGRANEGRVALQVDVSGDLPMLHADELKVKQIVLNLVTNAIKFTPPQGSVSVRAFMGNGEMHLAVKDTGIGISAEDMPRAMAPFGQISSPLARKTEGTGLGLPLVRVLAELHDGRFTLSSAPNDGTLATVSFPPQRILPAAPTA